MLSKELKNLAKNNYLLKLGIRECQRSEEEFLQTQRYLQ
ncbi:hypothetical protein PRO82_000385 [Candidatus Protochlamydia amoebophila]|nr:hypothetical protein [Candidatus Protochlamydia amoebophila]